MMIISDDEIDKEPKHHIDTFNDSNRKAIDLELSIANNLPTAINDIIRNYIFLGIKDLTLGALYNFLESEDPKYDSTTCYNNNPYDVGWDIPKYLGIISIKDSYWTLCSISKHKQYYGNIVEVIVFKHYIPSVRLPPDHIHFVLLHSTHVIRSELSSILDYSAIIND